jgi:hypothetical protein
MKPGWANYTLRGSSSSNIPVLAYIRCPNHTVGYYLPEEGPQMGLLVAYRTGTAALRMPGFSHSDTEI